MSQSGTSRVPSVEKFNILSKTPKSLDMAKNTSIKNNNLHKATNRRVDARIDVSALNYKVAFINPNDAESDVLLHNISLGGIGIVSQDEMQISDRVHFCFDRYTNHYFSGIIKWVEKLRDGRTYKYGIQFDIGNEKDLEIINAFVTQIFIQMPKEFIIIKAIELFTSGQMLQNQLKLKEVEQMIIKDDIKSFVKSMNGKIESSIKDIPNSKDLILNFLYQMYMLKSDVDQFQADVDTKYH